MSGDAVTVTADELQNRLFDEHRPSASSGADDMDEASIEDLAVRASALGVWVLDLEPRTFRSSDRFRELLCSESPEEASTIDWSSLFDLVHDDDRHALYDGLDAQLCGMWPLDLEIRMRAGSASHRWYRIKGHTHFAPDGTPTLVAGTLEDVTVRHETDEAIRRSEAALRRLSEEIRESEERFRQLSEHMEDLFWLEETASGRAIYTNPAMEHLLGPHLSAFNDAPRRCWGALAHELDHESVAAFTAGAQGAKQDATFRIVVDDAVRWIHARTFPIHDAAGHAYRSAGVAQDITEARKSQEQLREAQKLESIGQLAAGIAHEINTPMQYLSDNLRFAKDSLAPIFELLGHCRRLAADGIDAADAAERLRKLGEMYDEYDVDFLTEELPEALGQSLDGTQQVSRIVRAMKDFSHPGSADEQVKLDVNRTVESAATVCRAEWKLVADLDLDLAPELPPITSYSGTLGRVVLNLIVNAAHAIGDIVDGTTDKGTITVRTLAVDDGVEIAVQDTGGGIPEAIRARVFDPFFTSKEVGKGTGQGLSLAWATVVDLHGGRLEFDSEAGVGTTFRISLPLDGPPAAAPAPLGDDGP
ncbi:MAG: ATP-binding protein [Actinomycetota bacterium]